MLQPADNDNNMPDPLNNISVEAAEKNILPLIKRFFQHNGMRAQAAKADRVFIARDNSNNRQTIIAALRLCPVSDSWLLRSMCVETSFQRQGIGLHMLKQLKHELAEKQCYCFPYSHLQVFYQQAGFSLISPEQANADIVQKFNLYNEQNRDIQLMQFITD